MACRCGGTVVTSVTASSVVTAPASPPVGAPAPGPVPRLAREIVYGRAQARTVVTSLHSGSSLR